MIRAAFVENDVADHNEKFLPLPCEATRERMLTGYVHKALSHPLPKLLLSSPELVLIGANYSSCFLRFHDFQDRRALTSCVSARRFPITKSIANPRRFVITIKPPILRANINRLST